jgi:NAD(P)-dependent dehydrogenase (short-subunit alcohol dehydrogenase family)
VKRVEDLTVLVTGSTDGIGKRTALDLAIMGARVLVHGRDRRKGEATLEEIRSASGSGKLEYHNADLSSLDEVRRLADEVAEDRPGLDVLVNNAGIGSGRMAGRREVSADGYELRFAVNYLAPFLLTYLLLPALRRSAPSRVVNVSSLGQSPLDLSDLMLQRHYDGWDAYAQSKLALVMFTIDLAERLRDDGISVNAVNPGSLLDTNMVRESFGRGRGDVQQGADAIIHLATSPDVEGVTGRFFDRMTEARANHQAYDPSVREALRRFSCRATGIDRSSPLMKDEHAASAPAVRQRRL